MCLPDFIEFCDVPENEALIGYRIWKNPINNESLKLHSEYNNYVWKSMEGPHKILEKNSGLYAYNYNNYNNYYNYNYNNNYCNYNYYYNYYLAGIIKQFGRTAIHKTGQRSEYAKIDKLFTIRELDTEGPKEFLDWIKVFNEKIAKIAKKYNCQTAHWQDFVELQSK